MFRMALLAALAGCSQPVTDDGTPRRTARLVGSTLSTLAKAEALHAPERATRAGLDESDLGAAFHHRLADRSGAAHERRRLVLLDRLDQLGETPLPPDSSALAGHLRAVRAAYARAAEVSAFGYGVAGLDDARPYAIDHRRGAYVDAAATLLLDQPLETAEDAASYLARLNALGAAMESERLRLLGDARAGAAPPKLVLRGMERAAERLSREPAKSHPLVTGFSNWLDGAPGLDPSARTRLREEAEETVRDRVLPAYVRLRATANALAVGAAEAPGVWRLPAGRAYYQAALDYHASRHVDVEALRAALLEEVDAARAGLEAAIETAERIAALSDGTAAPITSETAAPVVIKSGVRERIAALEAHERSVAQPGARQDASDANAGDRERIVRAVAALTAASRGFTARPSQTGLSVEAVPAVLSVAWPALVYKPPAVDGSAPGLLYADDVRAATWSDTELEGRLRFIAPPARHLMSAAARDFSDTPAVRDLIVETAFTEGWALYAAGVARADLAIGEAPASFAAAVREDALHAALAAADIGVHMNQWTVEEAVDFLCDKAAIDRERADRLVLDISAEPGRRAAAIVGRDVFRSLRRRAQTVLAERFDPAAFHHAVLSAGPRPLDQLEADIERWYEAQL